MGCAGSGKHSLVGGWLGAPIRGGGGHSLVRGPGELLCAWRVAGGERRLATVSCTLSLGAAHNPTVIHLCPGWGAAGRGLGIDDAVQIMLIVYWWDETILFHRLKIIMVKPCHRAQAWSRPHHAQEIAKQLLEWSVRRLSVVLPPLLIFLPLHVLVLLCSCIVLVLQTFKARSRFALLLGRVSYDEQTAASLLINLDSCLATGLVRFDRKTVISQAFPTKLCFLDLGYLTIHYSIVLYHVT